mmetsp:Transcript_13105/g.34892  ORF Transcript_13105/g.34892 Transcript_13105/m.34892 type:complete len:211 (-) Transcript_13105:779-1411(-)
MRIECSCLPRCHAVVASWPALQTGWRCGHRRGCHILAHPWSARFQSHRLPKPHLDRRPTYEPRREPAHLHNTRRPLRRRSDLHSRRRGVGACAHNADVLLRGPQAAYAIAHLLSSRNHVCTRLLHAARGHRRRPDGAESPGRSLRLDQARQRFAHPHAAHGRYGSGRCDVGHRRVIAAALAVRRGATGQLHEPFGRGAYCDAHRGHVGLR